MRLKELLSEYELSEKMRNREIDRICTSTKGNLRGALFVCLAGSKETAYTIHLTHYYDFLNAI